MINRICGYLYAYIIVMSRTAGSNQCKITSLSVTFQMISKRKNSPAWDRTLWKKPWNKIFKCRNYSLSRKSPKQTRKKPKIEFSIDSSISPNDRDLYSKWDFVEIVFRYTFWIWCFSTSLWIGEKKENNGKCYVAQTAYIHEKLKIESQAHKFNRLLQAKQMQQRIVNKM